MSYVVSCAKYFETDNNDLKADRRIILKLNDNSYTPTLEQCEQLFNIIEEHRWNMCIASGEETMAYIVEKSSPINVVTIFSQSKYLQ